MTFTTIFVILLAVLFVVSYLTKRRFGVLGLALAAGAVISQYWANTLTPLIRDQGIQVINPPLANVVAAALVLLPPVLLLFSGPTYKQKIQRIIGSILFALLAVAFLLDALGGSLQLDKTGLSVYEFVDRFKPTIIVIGLAAAIADVLMTHTPRRRSRKSE